MALIRDMRRTCAGLELEKSREAEEDNGEVRGWARLTEEDKFDLEEPWSRLQICPKHKLPGGSSAKAVRGDRRRRGGKAVVEMLVLRFMEENWPNKRKNKQKENRERTKKGGREDGEKNVHLSSPKNLTRRRKSFYS